MLGNLFLYSISNDNDHVRSDEHLSKTGFNSLFSQVLFQLALTILEANKARLLACHDDGEAMTILNAYFERVISRDASNILEKTSTYKRERVTNFTFLKQMLMYYLKIRTDLI